ncbi:MAG: hypothetical protein CMP21_03755 [Rickettsiales bacterium]|nr:hypothetical protein [Rickettsiales bacterium]|tara:strand:+ start:149 stop:1849 length:1701 start_codon:yes stop_codon:yes gene_type:complete
MSSVLTNKFRIHNAKSFVEGFSEAEPTNIYTAIGKVSEWSSDDIYSGANETTEEQNPPTPLDHTQNEYEVWRNMFAAKKIKSTDITHVIPKVDWESGKRYSQYGDLDDSLLYDVINSDTPKPFYVVTDDFNVYKCLFNNNIESNDKPIHTSTTPQPYPDGYIWQYMYTISASSAFKFMTENFIPIQTLDVEPVGAGNCSSTNLQWNVQNEAKTFGQGRIDVISRRYASADSSGDGYVFTSAVISSISNVTDDPTDGDLTTITITTTLNMSNGYYDGMTVFSPSSSKAFVIKGYTQATGGDQIEVYGNSTGLTGTIQILPTVVVDGDGTGVQAVPVMGASDNASDENQIDSVLVLNGGSGYTTATVSFVNASTATTVDAKFDVIIPPIGGHGSDAVEELGGFFVMINTKFEYNESTTGKNLPVANDYRQISLIRQPKLNEGPDYLDASSDLYIQCKTLIIDTGQIDDETTFAIDETITQSGTNATGIIVDVLDGDNSTKEIRLVNVTGTFNLTNRIEMSTGLGADLISSIVDEELLKNSGDVMFVEQRSGITRNENQIEDIKIVLEF